MTVAEISEIPASEFLGWRSYFDIYPFTQDREDARVGLLCSVIANVSGRLKTMTNATDFIPDFLSQVTEKSLKQQELEWQAFKAKLASAKGLVKHAT
jgi:hypothetical protein